MNSYLPTIVNAWLKPNQFCHSNNGQRHILLLIYRSAWPNPLEIYRRITRVSGKQPVIDYSTYVGKHPESDYNPAIYRVAPVQM